MDGWMDGSVAGLVMHEWDGWIVGVGEWSEWGMDAWMVVGLVNG